MATGADADVAVVGHEHRNSGTSFFTVYLVRYQGRTTARRYSEFDQLHRVLAGLYPVQMSSFGVRLPQKALFNRDPQFLEERRVLLENYLRKVLTVSEFRQSSAMRNFLQIKDAPTAESAVTNLDGPATPTQSVRSQRSVAASDGPSPSRTPGAAATPQRQQQQPQQQSQQQQSQQRNGTTRVEVFNDDDDDNDDIDSLVQQVRSAAVIRLPGV